MSENIEVENNYLQNINILIRELKNNIFEFTEIYIRHSKIKVELDIEKYKEILAEEKALALEQYRKHIDDCRIFEYEHCNCICDPDDNPRVRMIQYEIYMLEEELGDIEYLDKMRQELSGLIAIKLRILSKNK